MDTKTQRCVSCWYCIGFERLLSLPSHRTIRRLVNTRTTTHLFHLYLYFMFHRFLSHSKSIFCVIVYAAPLPIVIVSDRYNRIGYMMHRIYNRRFFFIILQLPSAQMHTAYSLVFNAWKNSYFFTRAPLFLCPHRTHHKRILSQFGSHCVPNTLARSTNKNTRIHTSRTSLLSLQKNRQCFSCAPLIA